MPRGPHAGTRATGRSLRTAGSSPSARANFYGSTGSIKLNQPVVGMAPTPDHQGYWLVASDGGVFAFGDAGFYGSTGSIRLNKPIIGMIPTIDGRGYWLIASDGGVFAFGDALSTARPEARTWPTPSPRPPAPTSTAATGSSTRTGRSTAMATPSTRANRRSFLAATGSLGCRRHTARNGYWLASANGNVATFGDAAPYGNVLGTEPQRAHRRDGHQPDGAGYWLQGADGGIFTVRRRPVPGLHGWPASERTDGGDRFDVQTVGVAPALADRGPAARRS